MQLILAVDSDPRRSQQLASLVRARLQVDLVQATSAGEGLLTLKDRIPDLILTPPLLSPFDDGVLDEYLRELGAAGAHVQTVRIPVLNAEPKKKAFADRLFVLSRGRKQTSTAAATPDGCDPMVFADEIAAYLARAASAKQTVAQVAEALSRHEALLRPQEPLPTSPPVASSVAAAPTAINEECIVELTDAIELTNTPAVERQYVEPIETHDTQAAEQAHEILSEPAYVHVPASSGVDVPRLSTERLVDTMPNAAPMTPREPPRQARDKSATFEAALAAIRAAWIKSDETATAGSSADGSAATRSTAPSDVPPAQREGDTSTTRSDNSRGKTAAPDRHHLPDEWGMFDADQCGFPPLVEKLDEAAESKDATQRKSVTSRVISIR